MENLKNTSIEINYHSYSFDLDVSKEFDDSFKVKKNQILEYDGSYIRIDHYKNYVETRIHLGSEDSRKFAENLEEFLKLLSK